MNTNMNVIDKLREELEDSLANELYFIRDSKGRATIYVRNLASDFILRFWYQNSDIHYGAYALDTFNSIGMKTEYVNHSEEQFKKVVRWLFS